MTACSNLSFNQASATLSVAQTYWRYYSWECNVDHLTSYNITLIYTFIKCIIPSNTESKPSIFICHDGYLLSRIHFFERQGFPAGVPTTMRGNCAMGRASASVIVRKQGQTILKPSTTIVHLPETVKCLQHMYLGLFYNQIWWKDDIGTMQIFFN